MSEIRPVLPLQEVFVVERCADSELPFCVHEIRGRVEFCGREYQTRDEAEARVAERRAEIESTRKEHK